MRHGNIFFVHKVLFSIKIWWVDFQKQPNEIHESISEDVLHCTKNNTSLNGSSIWCLLQIYKIRKTLPESLVVRSLGKYNSHLIFIGNTFLFSSIWTYCLRHNDSKFYYNYLPFRRFQLIKYWKQFITFFKMSFHIGKRIRKICNLTLYL